MTTFHVIRSTPHNPEKRKAAFRKALLLLAQESKRLTIVLPMVNQIQQFGIEEILGDAAVKSLKNKREFLMGDILFALRCDRTIDRSEENGVILAMSCPDYVLDKLRTCTNAKAVVAMSFEPNELNAWAEKVGASLE